MKRFYSDARAGEHQSGLAILLDGRPLRTPGKALMHLPSQALAAAIAREWLAQTEEVRFHTMPLTQLAFTAIDRVVPNQAAVSAEIVKFVETDLVCYRAERPEELVARQAAAWDPLIDWMAEHFGARLATTAGIRPITQLAESVAAVQSAVAASGTFGLTALSSAAAAAGSVVVGLALVEEKLSAAIAADVASIEVTFQLEQWGSDAEEEARLARLKADFAAAELFLDLLSQP